MADHPPEAIKRVANELRAAFSTSPESVAERILDSIRDLVVYKSEMTEENRHLVLGASAIDPTPRVHRWITEWERVDA